MILDAATFRDAMADPRAPEMFSAALGSPLISVQVPDAAAAATLAPVAEAARALPCVVILLVPDPEVFAGKNAFLGDVLLTDDPGAPRPFTAAALEPLVQTVSANPIAATSFALLLRSGEGLSTVAGLTAESSTYSTLQAGSEFAAWRSTRQPRTIADDGNPRVHMERDGDMLRVTLTRAARRNALDAAMRDALAEAFALAVSDRELALDLRAEGPDFCAGGDLDEFGSRPDPALAHLTRLTRSPARLLAGVAHRATAHLHGACLGAGIELPAFAAQVVADSSTSIGLPEMSLGLIPGAGGTVSLPRRIGRQRTAWLGLSGRRLDAVTALSWGLVDVIAD